jgi:hypothetical protein
MPQRSETVSVVYGEVWYDTGKASGKASYERIVVEIDGGEARQSKRGFQELFTSVTDGAVALVHKRDHENERLQLCIPHEHEGTEVGNISCGIFRRA